MTGSCWGVGVGHKQIDQAYEKPYAKLVSYLDRLDVAHGSAEQVAAKLRAHVDAGADHVAIQSLNGHYAELAAALGL